MAEQRRRQPSRQELRDVRRVLATHQRKIEDHLSSIDTFLFDGPPSPNTAGYRELQKRFAGVGDELLVTRRELRDVDFDRQDRRRLMASLEEAAAGWAARARLLRARDRDQVKRTLRQIREHERKARLHGDAVAAYVDGTK